MKSSLRLCLGALLLLCLAHPAAAQYMKLISDNPADNTRMRSGIGPTVLTVTLDTDHDRNGSTQTCNSHTAAAGCGLPSRNPLDLGQYTITFTAVGGTVTWGTYSPAMAGYGDMNGGVVLSSPTQLEIDFGTAGAFDTPGLYTLGTLPVTPTSGNPAIEIARGHQPVNPYGLGTAFGSRCDATGLPNRYLLGDPADLCNSPTAPGDWTDADGVFAAAYEGTPVITAPATASGSEGVALLITATATDPDPTSDLTITASGFPPGMILQSIVRPSPATATISGTPGYDVAGTYVIRWMVRDSHGLSASTNTVLTIANTDRPPTLNPVANMQVCEGSTANQAITASDPDGDAMTFSKADGPAFMTVTTTSPASGNIHLAPGFTDAGTFAATARASDGFLNSDQSFSISVNNACRAPVLNPIADMTVVEGSTADQTITASDPDGDPLTFSKFVGPIFMTVATTNPGTGSATGTIHLAPGLADAGSYTPVVRVSDGTFTASGSFSITVQSSGNRCPTSNPGGAYSGLAGVPVSFDGSASSDPDGNPLSYAWDFDASDGIGIDAVGATVSHAYAAEGTFTVTLTVTDNGNGDPAQACAISATTTASIAAACAATVFNGYDTIRLGSGKPFWFAYVQPMTGCYSNSGVVVSSLVLKYAGRQVPASPGKSTVSGDKSGDGIQEIRVSFSKENLRILFSGTGLANGHNLVTLTIEANLVTGGRLSGTTQVDVVNNGSFSSASVSPNPLNPTATVAYTTSKPGFVRIDMFDIQGRLVRRIVDEPAMAAGTHEATIDGRGERGEKLPSGVYFIRGTSAEGEFKHIVTVLK